LETFRCKAAKIGHFAAKSRPRLILPLRGKMDRPAASMPLARGVPCMDAWTVGLFALAAFMAVSALVRLMLGRRDRLLAELSAQARDEQRKKQLAEAHQKKKQKKPAA
jgi:flagellar biosynthesis/type III secretory pathway M-ring protein FliF/YscJ